MNEVNGLPTLEDKSIDLCLTDPPYNVNYKQKSKTIKRQFYDDMDENYNKWCEQWFLEIRRICNLLIFTPGTPNLKLYFNIEKPRDLLYHYKVNGQGRTSVCRFNRCEILLVYGEIRKESKFLDNVFMGYLNNGFLREKCNYIHPCPKDIKLWKYIIGNVKPTSVLDPFLGSGTTAEVCTKLGIPWLGYEINKVYSQDINMRLKGCKREPKQINLMECIK